MAHKKAAGASKNGRDSGPRYLGVKINDGETASVGDIIIRQKGRDMLAGKGVGIGKDHTLFALANGTVKFGSKRKNNFDGTMTRRTLVSVV
ncbi:MAG: 50S ribosomal protein L27 [Patescibacteria group bacterium]|nr:50S ribosomal protein L27 [Patescibacteria group bacterium]MDE1945936.1 50S ribosomal protein L27 [Patescibacteria group bacterium]